MRKCATRVPVILIGAGLLAGGASAGCDNITTVPMAQSCAWSSPGAVTGNVNPANAQSSTVVLIDVSASYWPSQGQSKSLPGGPVQAAEDALVSNFSSGGTRLVSVGSFDGSSATISWQLGDVPLPQANGTSDDMKAQQDNAVRCLAGPVQKAMDSAPQASGTDVMAALGAAAAELGSTPPARSHVLVITDGLSNVGCLDLNKVLSQGESASDVVGACPDHSDLTHLQGADVQLYGVGFQALRPPMTTAQQTWLTNYWSDICAALKVKTAGSCIQPQLGNTTRVSTISRPDDPAIVFPVVRGSKVVIPAPLLFAFNSATLTPTARSYLDILIQQIRGGGHRITSVVGHTDSVGSAAYNDGLSQRRAQAVQAYLEANGFSGITAKGVGFSQPACEPEYTASGQPNAACMAKNRRVEIFLGG